MADLIDNESLWKKLTRLFRSGPVVRHKIAGAEPSREPEGTARAFKKELSNLYSHSLASYGQYERLARYCLSGDTIVATPDSVGGTTIKEMVKKHENGEKQYVFSYDKSLDRVVASPITDAWKTGEREIWEVTLDDGSVISCTDNHPFLLRDGSYLRADKLEENTALMPFKRYVIGTGYRYVFDKRGSVPEHVLVAEMAAGRKTVKNEEHVHHKNFCRTDNTPDNLDIMNADEHLAMHARINNKRFEDPENRLHMSNVIKKRWSEDGDLRKKHEAGNFYSEKGLETHRKNRVKFNKTFKPGRFNAGREDQKASQNANCDRSFTFQHICNVYTPGMSIKDVCKKLNQTEKKVFNRLKWEGYKNYSDFTERYSNHKVVSVKKTSRVEEVFDLTVPTYHNFALADKCMKGLIFVHNSDYGEMESTPEVASALDIYADESTSPDETGATIKIVSKNGEVKQVLETLFFEILNIEFNIWSWVRNMVKYGDFVLFVDAHEENGILNLLPIPINEIEREEGYDKSDPFAVRFRWTTQGNMILENWQIIHMRLLGNDNFIPYGSSMIEAARRIWRQLILIEDAMLVYRIVRSPERRVFKIDVGNISPDAVEQYMEQVKNKLRRSQIVDPTTGRVDLRYNPLSVDEDYFLPVRGDRGSDISTLAGGQFTGDIEDVQYIQNKLFAALKIPKAYLGYEGDVGSKAVLAQQDVRFSRTIQRIQKVIVAELNKIAIIHLYILGYRGEELSNFEIVMASSSTISEQQKLELWRMRFEIAGTAQEGVLDRETIYRDIFRFSDEQIQKIREGKRVDKLEDLTLEAMVAPTVTPEGETPPPGGEQVPGEKELPTTLGGEPGGEEKAAGGEEAPEINLDETPPETQTDGLDTPGNVVLEDGDDVKTFNKGSEGSDSVVAVDKGRNLFATGEDLNKHAFGTKKNTLSDPADMKTLRRVVTRPFSEDDRSLDDEQVEIFDEEKLDMVDESFRGAIERSQKLDEDLRRDLTKFNKLFTSKK